MTSILAATGLHAVGDGFPLLTFLVLVPALGALIVSVLPRESPALARRVGIGASLITLALSVLLVLAYSRSNGNFQFVSQHAWLKAFGIQWKLGVDGISLFLILLSGLMFPLALWFQRPHENQKGFAAWLLVLEAGCIGSFLALDLFLFFVFFEVVLVPMYFLIAGWGNERRNYAALKFFLYTLAGSAFLFIGMLALVYISARTNKTPVTFDFVTLQQHPGVSVAEARWLFVAFAIAFVVKVPVFPFHTWLPDTYEQSPIAGVVTSAAVMVKLGTYGLVRFCVELFPKAAHDMAPLLLTLAVIGMIYGAIIAAVQKDLRRVLAFSSLSHLGFIVLGTFAFSSAGLSGAVLQMINHGLSTGLLFLLVGMIYVRRHTTSIAELGGLQKAAPVLAAIMTVAVMSSIGVPGLNGFVGEFLILLGTFVTHRWWAVVGTATVVLAAVYLLWAYQRVFHTDPKGANATIPDMNRSERLIVAPLVLAIVFIGVYPTPLLQRIQPSVQRILKTTPGYDAHSAVNAAHGWTAYPSQSGSMGSSMGGSSMQGSPGMPAMEGSR